MICDVDIWATGALELLHTSIIFNIKYCTDLICQPNPVHEIGTTYCLDFLQIMRLIPIVMFIFNDRQSTMGLFA